MGKIGRTGREEARMGTGLSERGQGRMESIMGRARCEGKGWGEEIDG